MCWIEDVDVEGDEDEEGSWRNDRAVTGTVVMTGYICSKFYVSSNFGWK